MSLSALLDEASTFLASEFKLNLKKSKLKLYSPENWQRFCQVNSFDADKDGLYVPKSYSAYVRTDSHFLISNLFHEYYGHGLFCEHSNIGKNLGEISHESADSFLYNTINIQTQPLGLARQNIGNYEGFAIWLEALLCEETGNKNVWETKKERLPKYYISLFEHFRDAEQKLTRFGFMAQLGFPKYYSDKTLLQTVRAIYSNHFDNIELILLYGSQKPESDIDLVVVTNDKSQNWDNGWLDVCQINKQEFDSRIRLFDIEATIGLFIGHPIYDHGDLFNTYRRTILNQSITPEAIEHNQAMAELQKSYEHYFKDDPKKLKSSQGYVRSYLAVAEGLRHGRKLLTFDDIDTFLHNQSQYHEYDKAKA